MCRPSPRARQNITSQPLSSFRFTPLVNQESTPMNCVVRRRQRSIAPRKCMNTAQRLLRNAEGRELWKHHSIAFYNGGLGHLSQYSFAPAGIMFDHNTVLPIKVHPSCAAAHGQGPTTWEPSFRALKPITTCSIPTIVSMHSV